MITMLVWCYLLLFLKVISIGYSIDYHTMCQGIQVSYLAGQGNYTPYQMQWPQSRHVENGFNYQVRKYRGSRGGVRKCKKINTVISSRSETTATNNQCNFNNLIAVKPNIKNHTNFGLLIAGLL